MKKHLFFFRFYGTFFSFIRFLHFWNLSMSYAWWRWGIDVLEFVVWLKQDNLMSITLVMER